MAEGVYTVPPPVTRSSEPAPRGCPSARPRVVRAEPAVPFQLFLAVPTELADGRYPAPALVILALGGAVVVGAGVFFAVRFARSKDKR